MSDDAGARLSFHNVSKTFGTTRALRAVDLTVNAGEVHGLVGQNGSGKSTMVKILAGYHRFDRGSRITTNGVALRTPVAPRELRAAGVSIVHQDFGLIGDKTVAENIAVGSFEHSRVIRRIDWGAQRRQAVELLTGLESDIDPDVLVERLGPADRSIVAVARAMRTQRPGHGVIVLDESTRALPKESLGEFHRMLRKTVNNGGSALLISHNLEEVLAGTDRITVLRDGEVAAASVKTAEVTERDIARYMLGREIPAINTDRSAPKAKPKPGGTSIRLNRVTGATVSDVDLVIEPGEIVGFTGLAGAGWEELPYLLSGARPAVSGSLDVGAVRLELRDASVLDCLRQGIVLIPENRGIDGLAMTMSIRENLTLPWVRSKGRPWATGSRWQREQTREGLVAMNVRPPDPARIVGQLSGGNQQKVLLAKWLAGTPRLLILHEPTQAVDVGARLDILAAVRSVAQRGSAVIMASIQPADLAAVCDRIIVVESQRASREVGTITPDGIVEAVYAGAPLLASRVGRSLP